jgi:hypothetical protein
VLLLLLVLVLVVVVVVVVVVSLTDLYMTITHTFSTPNVVTFRISGQPGVALDDLVYIMTRIARQMEAEGFDKVFAAAEAATQAIEVRSRSVCDVACTAW